MVKGILNPIGFLIRIAISNARKEFDWGIAAIIGSSILSNLASGYSQKRSNESTEAANASNVAYQREFAKHGISWRVADAKRAGIHPLAALGAQTMSFSPSVVGKDYSGYENMGQSLGNMIKQLYDYSKKEEKNSLDTWLERAIKVKTLESLTEKNTVKPGSYSPSNVEVQPGTPTAMQAPGMASGIYPMMKYTEAPGGWIFPTPMQDIQELISEGMNPVKLRYWKDWIQDGKMDIKHLTDIRSEFAYNYRNFLKEIRPVTLADGSPLRKDQEYRYQTGKGFRLYSNIKKSQFYVRDVGIPNNNPINSMFKDEMFNSHNSYEINKMIDEIKKGGVPLYKGGRHY